MTENPSQDNELQQHRPQGYPTEELPTYRKVASHPEPTQPHSTPPPGGASIPLGSTGQLPVTGAPTASATQEAPRGPYVPTIVRGLIVLVAAALVFVWRLVDDPNWAVVGITIAVVTGGVLLLAAVGSLIVRHARGEREFDRMLSGS